jgi:hypothetical protein
MQTAEPTYAYVNEEEIDEELMCSLICLGPLVDPVVHNMCKISFCRTCIESAKWTCPTCRTGTKKDFSDVNTRMFLNMLNRLKVSCSRCTKTMPRSNFKEHIPNCAILCARGCGIATSKAEQTTHDLVCTFAVIPCSASSFGCTMQLKRCDMEEHSKECKWEQSRWIIEPLCQKIDKQSQQISQQNDKIDKLSKRLEELAILVTKNDSNGALPAFTFSAPSQ